MHRHLPWPNSSNIAFECDDEKPLKYVDLEQRSGPVPRSNHLIHDILLTFSENFLKIRPKLYKPRSHLSMLWSKGENKQIHLLSVVIALYLVFG